MAKNEMHGASWLSGPQKELVTINGVYGEKGSPLSLPQHKRVNYMLKRVDKLCKPDEAVADLFSGTFAAAKLCLELWQCRRFAGCETESQSFLALVDKGHITLKNK